MIQLMSVSLSQTQMSTVGRSNAKYLTELCVVKAFISNDFALVRLNASQLCNFFSNNGHFLFSSWWLICWYADKIANGLMENCHLDKWKYGTNLQRSKMDYTKKNEQYEFTKIQNGQYEIKMDYTNFKMDYGFRDTGWHPGERGRKSASRSAGGWLPARGAEGEDEKIVSHRRDESEESKKCERIEVT